MNFGVAFIVRDPDLARVRMLVEYLRPIADEFVFAVDDRTFPDQIEALRRIEGSKVKVITWQDDFAWARNQSIAEITRPWTLVLDPDELPSSELMNDLGEWAPDDGMLGALIWRKNWYCSEPQPTTGEWDWHLRIFRTGHGEFYRPIHELVKLDGRQEGQTRGTNAVRKMPLWSPLLHSKPCEVLQSDNAYYQELSKKTGVWHVD
jgi:hypothetical protein